MKRHITFTPHFRALSFRELFFISGLFFFIYANAIFSDRERRLESRSLHRNSSEFFALISSILRHFVDVRCSKLYEDRERKQSVEWKSTLNLLFHFSTLFDYLETRIRISTMLDLPRSLLNSVVSVDIFFGVEDSSSHNRICKGQWQRKGIVTMTFASNALLSPPHPLPSLACREVRKSNNRNALLT